MTPPVTPPEGTPPVVEPGATPPTSDDLLANLNLSEDAKKQLAGNTELISALTHNIQAKRDANAEAKANREKLEAFETSKIEADKAKLKEQGEFKKLYEQEQQKNTDHAEKLKKVTINNKVSLLASSKGIKKASYLKMFDTSALTVDENFEVEGLETAFDAFVNGNPDLFGATTTAQIPGMDGGKPPVTINATITAELQTLTKAARAGSTRDIARLREFKKQHKLM